MTTALSHAPVPVEISGPTMATPRFKSFFAARDALDAAMEVGELKLSGPQNQLLRYLLEHAWYSPRDPKEFGWVIESALDYERIARRLGIDEKTVRRAIEVLEDDDHRLVSRYGRPLLTGGKDPDAIRIDWLWDTESASESGTESASDPGTESASSFYKETREESSSRGRDDDGSASPVGQDRGGRTPHTPRQTRDSGRAASDYGVAVCRALNELLPEDDSIKPTAKLLGAWDLLARLWPAPQNVPAAEIVWGVLSDSAHNGQTRVRIRSLAAFLASSLEHATEADIRAWVERGEERMIEEEAERQEQAQEVAAQEQIESFRTRLLAQGMTQVNFNEQLRRWRQNGMSNDRILNVLPRLLEKVQAKRQTEERIAQQVRDDLEQTLPEYAELFHGGDIDAARNDFAELSPDQLSGRMVGVHRRVQQERDRLAEEQTRAVLRPLVLDYVLGHATEASPASPEDVARELDTDVVMVHGLLADLAGGSLYQHPDGHPPLKAWAGNYWPRPTDED